MAIKISNPHSVKKYQLFTNAGWPVYRFKSKEKKTNFSLDKSKGNIFVMTDNPNSILYKNYAEQAEKEVLYPCKWEHVGETEVMDIFF